MHHRGTRVAAPLVAAGLILGLSVAAAPAASARIIDRGVDTESGTNDFVDCGGINLRVDYDVRDVWVDKLRAGDLGSFAYLTPWFTHIAGTTTQKITNLDTGRSFTGLTSLTEWDQRLLSQTETAAEYRRMIAGHFTVVGEDGRTWRKENGTFRYDFRYDNQGTADPSDDTDAFIDGSFRQNGTNGSGDFCADVVALTT
jgi:hypothetical protein